MGARNDLTFDRGEDWIIDMTCYEADGETPVDLTGAAVTMAVSEIGNLPVGYISSAPTSGRVVVRCTPAQQTTAAIEPGKYDYSLRVTLASGVVSDQSVGVLNVRDSRF